jgi:hypothetical protein
MGSYDLAAETWRERVADLFASGRMASAFMMWHRMVPAIGLNTTYKIFCEELQKHGDLAQALKK